MFLTKQLYNNIHFNMHDKANTPPLNKNYERMRQRNYNKLVDLFNKTVQGRIRLETIIDSVKRRSRNFAKILPYYIPILNSIESHMAFLKLDARIKLSLAIALPRSSEDLSCSIAAFLAAFSTNLIAFAS